METLTLKKTYWVKDSYGLANRYCIRQVNGTLYELTDNDRYVDLIHLVAENRKALHFELHLGYKVLKMVYNRTDLEEV